MRVLFNKIFLNKIFLISLLLIGCSKSDDDSNVVDNTPSINSIQVLVSSAEVTVGTQYFLLYLIIQVKTEQVKQNFIVQLPSLLGYQKSQKAS